MTNCLTTPLTETPTNMSAETLAGTPDTAAPTDMHAALADTRAVLDNPTVDQHYCWFDHASDAELEKYYKNHCLYI